MALRLVRPKHRSFANPSLIHLFCTSSNSGDGSDGDNNHSSLSSYLSDVRARLRNQQQRERPASSISNSPVPHSKPNSISASLEEIQKNLSEFRRRSAVSPPAEASPTPSQSQPHFSFQESYIKNVSEQRERMSFDAIKESLQKLGPNSGTNRGDKRTGQFLSLTDFKHTLKFNPSDGNVASLAFSELPKSMKEKTREREAATKTDFVKIYSHSELGEKLKQLRPERKEGEQWFSLEELNERLVKLREMEQKEAESRSGFPFFKDLREGLTSMNDTEKQKASSQRVDTLDFMGRTPKFMLYPPKENLVEQYFHPDNMSSAEKMKIELSKVRDEFKMSESDCGSARVQVAQLTTKIKHLSSVLHKKDKHSRKGLIAMVQKRKKLLKYLRRTDWDSYCFVLSKLGLRDTPDYKVRDYAATTGQEKNNKKRSGKQKKKGKNLQTQSA